jgi:hypothetical protein
MPPMKGQKLAESASRLATLDHFCERGALVIQRVGRSWHFNHIARSLGGVTRQCVSMLTLQW